MLITPVRLKDLERSKYTQLLRRCMLKVDGIMDDVASIVEDIGLNGDSAVQKYTKKLDNANISSNEMAVTQIEITAAYDHKIDEGLTDTIGSLRDLHNNLNTFYSDQLKQHERLVVTQQRWGKQWTVGRIEQPMERVGAYAPNGTAPYPTTVLMAVTPARIAGVKEIVVTTKPNNDGSVNDWILIACDIARVDKIFKVGGVQAIGALAFGTETIPRVNMIVGPGNIYVTAAKMYVRAKGYCDIDFPAGPSEILIVADESANPGHIVWDMLSQAEHDKNACAILITTSERIAYRVAELVEEELQKCAVRKDIKEEALKNYGSILITDTIDEALDFSNDFAPEHLAIMLKDSAAVLEKVRNAGTVCIGQYSPVAVSDYMSGVNHILPTGGWAKTCSGLSIATFRKGTTFQDIPVETLKAMMPHVSVLSKAENLYDAHGKSVEKRFDEE